MKYTNYPHIVASLTRIINKNIGVRKSAILAKDSLQELGLDQLDVVNLILAVEKEFKIIIPDDVPVESVTDLARFVHAQAAA